MYYNITIKSNGSEYSLESNNKEITQREMDLYFAFFFDASSDFKSKIKKIEIKNENVVSIEKIENPTQQTIERVSKISTQKSQLQPEIVEVDNIQPIQNIQIEHINQPQYNQVSMQAQQTTNTIKEPDIIEMDSFIDVSEDGSIPKVQQTENYQSFQNYQQNAVDIQSINQAKEEQYPKTEIPDIDFDVPENIKQNYNNSISSYKEQTENITQHNPQQIQYNQIDNYNTSEKQDFNNYEAFEQIGNNIAFNNNSTDIESLNASKEQSLSFKQEIPKAHSEIDELLSLAQSKVEAYDINTAFKESNRLNEQPKNNTQENIVANSQFKQEKINDIFSQPMQTNQNEQDLIQQTDYNNNLINTNQIIEPLNVQQINQQQNHQFSAYETTLQAPQSQNQQMQFNQMQYTQNSSQLINNANINQQQNITSQQDLKMYLNQFKPQNAYETFLICAHYIRHVIQQENFTMKFINSKLFQATGTIANMAVVNDLTNKGYIGTIDSPDLKKYYLTPIGEQYLDRKLQG